MLMVSTLAYGIGLEHPWPWPQTPLASASNTPGFVLEHPWPWPEIFLALASHTLALALSKHPGLGFGHLGLGHGLKHPWPWHCPQTPLVLA